MTASVGTYSSRLADIVGPENLVEEPARLAVYAVDGLSPSLAVRPGSAEEIAEIARAATAEKLALIPTAGRTKLNIGMPPERYDVAVDMARLNRVIAYDPGDLTLGVEAGIGIASLLKTLAAHAQFLPLAMPFAQTATVGGTLATGIDTPLRHFYGMPRDYVLGMEFVAGEGVTAKAGGRVVKNVTGYDLHKLLLGAIGTLGIITRINFKTFPLPAKTRTWIAGFDAAENAFSLARRIASSPLTPYAVEIAGRWPAPGAPQWQVAVAAAGDDKVLERCSREVRALAGQCSNKSFDALVKEQEDAHWNRVCEFPALLLKEWPGAVLLRAGVLPGSMPSLVKGVEEIASKHRLACAFAARAVGAVHAGLLPGGSLSESMDDLTAACREVMQAAGAAGGHASIEWCPLELKRRVNIWGEPRPDLPLMKKLKDVLDSKRIFSPGRFMGGL